MKSSLTGYGVQLVPVEEQHLPTLRHWRNDPAISQYMVSQKLISEQDQLNWFQHISQLDSQQHFVICYRQQPIGAANIKEQQQQPISKQEIPDKHEAPKKDIAADTRQIEPGIYLGEEKFRNNIMAFAPSLLLLDYCFDDLKVSQLYAQVHEQNSAALNYNKKLGYREVSTDGLWIKIQLSPADYQEATTSIKQFLSRRTQ